MKANEPTTETAAPYEVKLGVFEGPFQLLLSLIADRRLDVCDVPISQLTNDYLAHIEQIQRADLELTTEFLVVASTLLALKARALLPQETSAEDDEEAVERDLLVARLLEVRTFQEASAHIGGLLTEGDRYFPARPAPDDEALRALPTLAEISSSDLGRTLSEVVRETLRGIDTTKVLVDQVSTQEAAAEIVQYLELGPRRFAALVEGRNVVWAVALFLAMLELAMRGEVELGAGATVGEVELRLRRAA